MFVFISAGQWHFALGYFEEMVASKKCIDAYNDALWILLTGTSSTRSVVLLYPAHVCVFVLSFLADRFIEGTCPLCAFPDARICAQFPGRPVRPRARLVRSLTRVCAQFPGRPVRPRARLVRSLMRVFVLSFLADRFVHVPAVRVP